MVGACNKTRRVCHLAGRWKRGADDCGLAGNWFGASLSEAERRRQIAVEIEKLETALAKVAADRKTLEKILSRPMDSRFYPELRKLEGAEFDAPFNFAWRIDYADIFSTGRAGPPDPPKNSRPSPRQALSSVARRQAGEGGFDSILGNQPFVTARNPEKRELYRERWKRVCSFFELSFGPRRNAERLC